MSETDDQGNPLDMMMPPSNNPEYHRKKAEYEENKASEAGQEVVRQHGHLADRMQRVRRNPPQAQNPAPTQTKPIASQTARQHTGLTVDETMGRPNEQRVEPRLPVDEPNVAPSPTSASLPIVKSNEHPLLSRLKQDFGLEGVEPENIDIGEHIFAMRALDMGSVAKAVRFADMMAASPRENVLLMHVMLVAFSVVTIDDEPVWKVFGVDLPEKYSVVVEGERKPIFKPTNPPAEVKMSGATALADFLNDESSPGLMGNLWKAYKERVDKKGALEEMLARLEDGEDGETEDIPLP